VHLGLELKLKFLESIVGVGQKMVQRHRPWLGLRGKAHPKLRTVEFLDDQLRGKICHFLSILLTVVYTLSSITHQMHLSALGNETQNTDDIFIIFNFLF